MSERGGDRRQECDRSNLSDASEHEHDDDEDIEDTGTVDASIAMDIEDESDDGPWTVVLPQVCNLTALTRPVKGAWRGYDVASTHRT